MSSPLPLSVRPPHDASMRALVDSVAASLPLSVQMVENGELTAIAGEGNWYFAAHEMIDAGVKGLIVDHPAAIKAYDAQVLNVRARQLGVPIVLRFPWMAHPAVADAMAHWDINRQELALIDNFASALVGSIRDTMVAQLFILQSICGPLQELKVDGRTDHGYLLSGRTEEGTAFAVSAVSGAASPHLQLRLLGRTQAFELQIEESRTWAPALAFQADMNGEFRRPPIFESGDRAAWRNLLLAMNGERKGRDLDAFVQILQLLESTEGTLP